MKIRLTSASCGALPKENGPQTQLVFYAPSGVGTTGKQCMFTRSSSGLFLRNLFRRLFLITSEGIQIIVFENSILVSPLSKTDR